MENQNTAKSIPNFVPYQIPIEDFQYEMPEKASKEKKNEILELLSNHNEINSSEEFENINYLMKRACRRGDVELLEIYLNKEIEIDSEIGRLTFKINKANKTASLFKVLESRYPNLNVPRTIEYEGESYLITSIIGSGQYKKILKGIEFPSNSEVRTIYEDSFFLSEIESIFIPPSLIKLQDGWCRYTNKLTKITISESNDWFLISDNKLLLGKSEDENDEFDILLFACKDIKEAQITSNIKIITSYSFFGCQQLTKVEIPLNSNLQKIGDYAFSETKITRIFIPSNVSMICKSAFDDCYLLSKVGIPNLQTIGENAFSGTQITHIFIPSNVLTICGLAFAYCKKLSKVEIPPNSKLQMIGTNAFSESKITHIFIPSSVSIIWKYAFSLCEHLSKVEIPLNSNLQTIEEYTFSQTKITQIFIPSSVSMICECAFFSCEQLSKIDISPNSNLQKIGCRAFLNTDIKQFYIPSNVSCICYSAFDRNLEIIEISVESNLEILNNDIFEYDSKVIVMIPQEIRKFIYVDDDIS